MAHDGFCSHLSRDNLGISLKYPNARMIWQGNKKTIILGKMYRNLKGKYAYIIDSNNCYGIIKVTGIDEVDRKGISAGRESHRLSDEFLEENFGGKMILYSYSFDLADMYDAPVQVESTGGDEIIEDVKFVSKIIPEKKKENEERTETPDRLRTITDRFGEITLINDFISLVGSAVKREEGHKPNDIDIHIRFDDDIIADYLRRAIEVRLGKKAGKDIYDKLHFIFGDSLGSHDTFVPLYRLALVPSSRKVVEMSEFSPFFPMKPARRFYKIEEASNYMFKDGEEKFAIEKKVDGFRMVIQKFGNDVRIYTDGKKDVTSYFPKACAYAKDSTMKDFVIDCEAVTFDGSGNPLGRSALHRFITGSPKDDSDIVFFAFDLIFLDKDISGYPWSERSRLLNSMKLNGAIKTLGSIIVSDRKDAERAISVSSRLKGSEGAMIKRYDGKYRKDGESDDWIKYRKELSITAKAIEAKEADGGMKSYKVGIDISEEEKGGIIREYISGGELMLGNTFNTAISASAGDRLDINVEEIWRHRDKEGKVRYSIHKPKVMSISTDKTTPLSEIDAMVVSRGAEVENSEKPGISDAMNFPDSMKKAMSETEGFRRFVMQWHYRGHRITENERKSEGIPDRYIWKTESLHNDLRFETGRNLQGITLLSPTSTDESVPDLVGDDMRNVRAVLKPPEPLSWIRYEGIQDIGSSGSTSDSPSVFVIVAKGKYRTETAEDHRIIVEFDEDSGDVSKSVYDDADAKGILIGRKISALKKLPEKVSFHIAHIGDRHIILADRVKSDV